MHTIPKEYKFDAFNCVSIPKTSANSNLFVKHCIADQNNEENELSALKIRLLYDFDLIIPIFFKFSNRKFILRILFQAGCCTVCSMEKNLIKQIKHLWIIKLNCNKKKIVCLILYICNSVAF